ncbi:hypothetical protein [Cryobacterium sp. Y57]|uniref:hypothetical protein n=1 Tax=Cryobacterium sp. Y57 TaxID=2048287 RepID=UPI001E352DC0|nr:hypothetical protein [Cryobacterium sp. Y57]
MLVIWATSRLLTTTLLASLFIVATRLDWNFASHRSDPNFFTFSGSWDSSFYRQIALRGYPTELPTDVAGNVLPNAWAFLPVFPWLVRGVSALTGIEFYVAGVLVATLLGALAALALYRLLSPRVGVHSALWAVALFCFGPLSFILQAAYAESLFSRSLLALSRAFTTPIWSLSCPGGPASSVGFRSFRSRRGF